MVTSVKYTELPQLSLQGKLIKSRRLQSKAVKKNKREIQSKKRRKGYEIKEISSMCAFSSYDAGTCIYDRMWFSKEGLRSVYLQHKV